MKYKIGDEVLVRMIIQGENSITQDPIALIKSTGQRVALHKADLYSLAPEFTPGEIIEMSYDNEAWVQDKFTCHDPSCETYPFRGVFSWYKYARKIKPKEEVKFSTMPQLSSIPLVALDTEKDILHIHGRKYKLTKVEE